MSGAAARTGDYKKKGYEKCRKKDGRHLWKNTDNIMNKTEISNFINRS